MTERTRQLVRLAVLSGILPTAGCELRDVIIPEGDSVVIVQAVMRPDLAKQFVVVERSFRGAVEVGDFEIGPIPDGGYPRVPVEDASVSVANVDLPSDPCGNPVAFSTDPNDHRLYELPGVYWSPESCPTMRPGDRLELRVETGEGEIVTGTTRVPGLAEATLAAAGDSGPFSIDDTTTFNRDRDTLRVRLEVTAGRLLQLEVRRGGALSGLAQTRILVDATALTLPGDALDVFENADGEDVFRAGRHYGLTVAVTDTSYFDFARSRNNELTGRGFINHLTGGLGVFGSLAARSTFVTAVGDVDDPREGVYRISGTIQDVGVDITASVYLARSLPVSEFSAFVAGTWLYWDDLPGTEGEQGWLETQLRAQSIDGRFAGDTLVAVVPLPESQVHRLRGIWTPGATFTLAVGDSAGLSARPLGTVSAAQQ